MSVNSACQARSRSEIADRVLVGVQEKIARLLSESGFL